MAYGVLSPSFVFALRLAVPFIRVFVWKHQLLLFKLARPPGPTFLNFLIGPAVFVSLAHVCRAF